MTTYYVTVEIEITAESEEQATHQAERIADDMFQDGSVESAGILTVKYISLL
jgi:hypothetical protein